MGSVLIEGGSPFRPPPGPLERIKGGLLLCSLLYTWFVGCMVVPVALYRLTVLREPGLSVLLAFYYAYRVFFPAKEWPLFNRMYRNGTRYFNRTDTIFDGFKSIEPNSKRLICVHPHGILTIGWAYVSCDPVLVPCSRIKWLVTESLMQLPFISDFLAWNGFAMATKDYMNARMKKGQNLGLLPGGFEEATLYAKGAYRVYIEHRTGFVALALRHGYKLQPAFVFGEEQTYWAFTGLIKARLWLNRYKLPGVIFAGAFGMLPHWGIDMVTVIGPPLELPIIAKPTPEEVAKYHQQYKQALIDLFDRHKGKYAPPGATLEIF